MEQNKNRKPTIERMMEKEEQGLPCSSYQMGDYEVTVCYQPDGPTMEELLKEYLNRMMDL